MRDSKSIFNQSNNHTRNSEASEDQRHALLEINNALRETIEYCMLLNTGAEKLGEIASQIRLLNESLEPAATSRMLEYYKPTIDPESHTGLQPYSPIGGWQNPVSPAINYRVENKQVIAEVRYGLAHEGPPHSVHGGIIAGVYDQVMATACTVDNKAGPTAYIKVNYLHSTPLFETLRFQARIDRTEGRKIFVTAECSLNGKVLSEAKALFIRYATQ